VSWASTVAEQELARSLPRRWAHSQGVAARASTLAELLRNQADLLRSAAVLHDVEYAPRLAVTASIRRAGCGFCGTGMGLMSG
jgi:HD superfamily phosphohydrolase YqeK